MAQLFFVLSALSMLAALHPFVTYPLSLRLLGRKYRFPEINRAAVSGETFAICVCAYNEESVISRKAENLLALKRAMPGLGIYIYVDAGTDGTAEILQAYRPDINLYISPERHGKTYGMNILMKLVKASIVIFTDANVMLNIESVRALPWYFSDPAIGCVCGHLKYTGADKSATASNGSLYWRLEEHIKQMESDTGSAMGADGSIFAIRSRLHKAPPDDVIDDMYVSLNILCDGYRIVRAPEVIAYEESISAAHEEFRRKIRIACQAFNVHRLLWPRLRQLSALNLYKYVSHKLMRWLTVYWLALAFVFFELGVLAYGLAAVALALAALAVLLLAVARNLPVLHQIFDILSAFTATGIGVWRSLQGDRFQTWAPAESIRQKG